MKQFNNTLLNHYQDRLQVEKTKGISNWKQIQFINDQIKYYERENGLVESNSVCDGFVYTNNY